MCISILNLVPQACWLTGAVKSHRAGGLEAELGERLRGKLEVCWQSRLLIAGTEGRLAVGGGSLWRDDRQCQIQFWHTSLFSNSAHDFWQNLEILVSVSNPHGQRYNFRWRFNVFLSGFTELTRDKTVVVAQLTFKNYDLKSCAQFSKCSCPDMFMTEKTYWNNIKNDFGGRNNMWSKVLRTECPAGLLAVTAPVPSYILNNDSDFYGQAIKQKLQLLW